MKITVGSRRLSPLEWLKVGFFSALHWVLTKPIKSIVVVAAVAAAAYYAAGAPRPEPVKPDPVLPTYFGAAVKPNSTVTITGTDWTCDRDRNLVIGYNAATKSKLVVNVDASPSALAVDRDSILWVSHSMQGSLVKIDPTSGQILGRAQITSGINAVAIDGNTILVTNGDKVWRICAASSQVIATYRLAK